MEEPSGAAESQVVAREMAKGWLSNQKRYLDDEYDSLGTAEANWLLVFDNADDFDVLADYTNFFGSGSVLVTSRHPLAKESTSEKATAIDLQPLDDDEGALLLQEVAGGSRNSERKEALHIVQNLGGLPLAISQMAGIIRRQILSYSDFLEMYNDDNKRMGLYNIELEQRQPTARGNLATIWAVELLSAGAKSLLQLLAFLDPDAIPDFISDQLVKATAITMPQTCPKTRFEFNAARAELLEPSLIQRNQTKGESWLHRVLQDTLRAKMNDREKVLVFSAAVELIHLVWPKAKLDQRHNTERWDVCQRIYSHIQYLRGLYSSLNANIDANFEVKFASLLNEAGW